MHDGVGSEPVQRGERLEQAVYADRAGIHHNYVNAIERGARNSTISVAETLAVPLDVTASELLS